MATTGMATLVDATLLRPLPFPAADRLVRVWLAEAGWAGAALRGLLYDVGLFDPWAFAGAWRARGRPAPCGRRPGAARRVASVDPLAVLRSDQT